MTPRRIWKTDVLCVGAATFDMVFGVPHHPDPDEKMTARSFTHCGGGPAANAAVAIARLSGRAAFGGYLGKDLYGDQHRRELREEGVCLELVVRGSAPTPVSAILVKPDGRRSVSYYHEATPPLSEGDITLRRVEPSVILFDGHQPLASPPLAREAQDKGVATVLDAGSVHPGTIALADQVDYLVCSEKFARNFTEETELEAALQKLRECAPIVVITCGERGLLWSRGGESGRMPAFQVDAVDTTGAGDAFHGALAFCIAVGKDWEFTLRYASAVAALTCTKLGARPALPTWSEVDDFLTENSHSTIHPESDG